MNSLAPTAAALAAALLVTGCQKAEDAAFGQRVRAYLLDHPEVIREAVQKLNEKEQQAAEKASTDALRRNRSQLERDPRDFVANPNGKVTVVEFFDYRCGYCKLAAAEVVRMIEQNPDVRFVFKEWPFFGDVSIDAAKAALTPAGKSKGLELYARLMGERALDQAALDRHLREVGLDPAEVRHQSADPAIARQLVDVEALRAALHLQGTPAFIVGDVLIPGADMQALKAAVEAARKG